MERKLTSDGVIAYEAHVGCQNCGKPETVSIPKGTTITEYQKGRICSECGCRMDGGE